MLPGIICLGTSSTVLCLFLRSAKHVTTLVTHLTSTTSITSINLRFNPTRVSISSLVHAVTMQFKSVLLSLFLTSAVIARPLELGSLKSLTEPLSNTVRSVDEYSADGNSANDNSADGNASGNGSDNGSDNETGSGNGSGNRASADGNTAGTGNSASSDGNGSGSGPSHEQNDSS